MNFAAIPFILFMIFIAAVSMSIVFIFFMKLCEISSDIMTEISEFVLSFFGFYETVELDIKESEYLWRKSYTKFFHFDFLTPLTCYDGTLRFGTYYKVWTNGYFDHDSISIPTE